MVLRDFAAPTAKRAINKTIAARMTAGIPVIKTNGLIGMNAGMNARTAVDSAPGVAETIGLLRPSSVVLSRSLASALSFGYSDATPKESRNYVADSSGQVAVNSVIIPVIFI
jgi:hypothetical protein